MKDEGVIEDYAVAGAMAILFWTEPVPTYDLDVLVLLPASPSPIVSLDPIYKWTEARGYSASEEHILIEGVPTQFLPSPSRLAHEAIESAETLDYDGVPVKVARPEYRSRMRSLRDMGSSSKGSASVERPLPTPELVERLRAGKASLRERRRALPLPEKVRQMLELQRIHWTIVSRRRPMRSWEHPWDVEP